jgi:hypothetical protein
MMLLPGNYTLLAATQSPGQESSFGLNFESTGDLTISQVWPPKSAKDSEAVEKTKQSGAAEEVREALSALLREVLLGKVQGIAQVNAAEKLFAIYAREEQRREAERKRQAGLRLPVGMDDTPSPLFRVERALTQWCNAAARMLGLTGIPRILDLQAARTYQRDVEAAERSAEVYSRLRGKSLFEQIRLSSQPLPPFDEQARESAARYLNAAGGSVSDPEIALVLRLLDLPIFRYDKQAAMPIPSLEVFELLPLDLKALSEPARSEKEENLRLLQRGDEEVKILSSFPTSKSAQEEKLKQSFTMIGTFKGSDEVAGSYLKAAE